MLRAIGPFTMIVRYLVWVIVTILILETAVIEVSVLLASMAALLIGVGLGSNIFSGYRPQASSFCLKEYQDRRCSGTG
jgi:hypothetical protein